MKIRKTLVVCPESRRSEIVAVLFPSSTSFPETKTLKRIKKENIVRYFTSTSFSLPKCADFPTVIFFGKDAKTLPGCLFLGHRLLFHLCIYLSWIFFFLKTILYFWRDAKRRERTLPGCLSSGHPLLLPLFILLQGKVRFVSRHDLAKKWRQGHPFS